VIGEAIAMDYKLKSISKAGSPEAASKAERYRFLNEPEESESICRDILALDPSNQQALRLLGLAITDQFIGVGTDRYRDAKEAFEKLTDRYERLYHTGLLYERRAKAQIQAGQPPHTLLPLLEQALACYAEAEAIHPPENDDAILRWNRCVRLLEMLKSRLEEGLVSFDVHDAPPI
jgi:tetratricopeptide (TPR) repeat protein